MARFDPMVRIAKTPTKADERPTTSLGLGLYIAREIVNAHGGKIDVASSVESGTSFTVTLPRRSCGPQATE
jgi:signal transduction histidine kinase